MASFRRLRGTLLRLVLARRPAIVIGLLLSAPAAWLLATEHPWENWITDALTLVVGATGVALLVAGLGGRRGDWIEPRGRPRRRAGGRDPRRRG